MKKKPKFDEGNKKCKHCNGKGAVQIAPNIRGLTKCPFCNGTGKSR